VSSTENRDSDGGEPGFLYLNQDNPWPEDNYDAIDRFQMIGLKKVMAN
jgi:hypothetical protein